MAIEHTRATWDSAFYRGVPLLILLSLADHLNGKTGQCFPSYKRLEVATGASPATIADCMRRLEADGVLRVERTGGRVNHYSIDLSRLGELRQAGRAKKLNPKWDTTSVSEAVSTTSASEATTSTSEVPPLQPAKSNRKLTSIEPETNHTQRVVTDFVVDSFCKAVGLAGKKNKVAIAEVIDLWADKLSQDRSAIADEMLTAWTYYHEGGGYYHNPLAYLQSGQWEEAAGCARFFGKKAVRCTA